MRPDAPPPPRPSHVLRRLSPCGLGHQVGEAVEEVRRVVRAGGGLGVVLDREGLESFLGIAELEASWPAMWADLKKMAYFTEVAGIEVDGDVAKARCYSRQIMFRKDGGVGKVVGLYRDTLSRRGGIWLYSRREFEFVGAEPAPGQVLPGGNTPRPGS